MYYDVSSCIATAIGLPLLGSIAVGLRFYVRKCLKPTFIGVDDWLILIAIIFVWGQGTNQIIEASIGELGRDNQPTDPIRLAHQMKSDQAVLVFEKATYTIIKLSVLFFFRRIFGVRQTFRIINDVLIVAVTAWGIIFLFTSAFVCGLPVDSCVSLIWLSLWFAITDVIGDIVILVLPYPQIRKLQMTSREKYGFSATFMLGFLSTVAGIIRLGYVSQSFSVNLHPQAAQSHSSNHRTPQNVWTTIEVSLGVLAACLPPLGPLIRRAPIPTPRMRNAVQGPRPSTSHTEWPMKRIYSVECLSQGNQASCDKMRV